MVLYYEECGDAFSAVNAGSPEGCGIQVFYKGKLVLNAKTIIFDGLHIKTDTRPSWREMMRDEID
jgi:hypothetical protein